MADTLVGPGAGKSEFPTLGPKHQPDMQARAAFEQSLTELSNAQALVKVRMSKPFLHRIERDFNARELSCR